MLKVPFVVEWQVSCVKTVLAAWCLNLCRGERKRIGGIPGIREEYVEGGGGRGNREETQQGIIKRKSKRRSELGG